MATRALSSKLLNSLGSFTRPLNSAASSSSITAVSPLNLDENPESAALEKQPVTLDLDDHQKLFASVSTMKLLRSSAILGMAAKEPFVDFGMRVMNSRLMETSLIRNIILKTAKHSFFEHFCAGETTEEAEECVRKIHEAGLRGMLVYAVEHTSDNSGCDRNLEGFLRSVEFSKSLPPSSEKNLTIEEWEVFNDSLGIQLEVNIYELNIQWNVSVTVSFPAWKISGRELKMRTVLDKTPPKFQQRPS